MFSHFAICKLLFHRMIELCVMRSYVHYSEHFPFFSCKRSLVNKELRVNLLTEVPLIIVGTLIFISTVFISVYQGVQLISCRQYDIYGFKLSTIQDGQTCANRVLTFMPLIESIKCIKNGSQCHRAWPLCHEVIISDGIFGLVFYLI